MTEENENEEGSEQRRLGFVAALRVHVLAFLAHLIVRCFDFTLRWKFIGLQEDGVRWTAQEPCILSFWHGHQVFMPKIYLHFKGDGTRPILPLISEHGDGRIAAYTLRWFGIDSVAGSSSHNARAAVLRLKRCVKRGCHIAITPDGPRGPVYVVKEGIIKLGQILQVPIYPTAICAKKAWRLKSWDRMFIPKPFSEVVLIRGEPLRIPRELSDAEFEECRLKLERAMHETIARAERELGN